MSKQQRYEPRTYRRESGAEDLESFTVINGETNLHIQVGTTTPDTLAECKRIATQAVQQARQEIQQECLLNPVFKTSLTPISVPKLKSFLVQTMVEASNRAEVGPMATVAGAIAQYVGRQLRELVGDVIIENGGDIFIYSTSERITGIWAGKSPLSGKFGVVIPANQEYGVCTSSATVGPSYSAGKCDAALIVAEDAAFADAMASALGNRVIKPEQAQSAVEWALSVTGVLHAVVIIGDTMAAGGTLDMTRL